MRVSSLSNERVQELLGKYFIPVYLSRDSYEQAPPTPADQAELARIDREAKRREMEGGAVCAFILAPDGHLLASQRVQKASQPAVLIPLLEGVVERERVKAGEVQREQRKQVNVKASGRDNVVPLNVWTRLDGSRAKYGLSVDRVELSAEQVKEFLPPKDQRQARTWTVDAKAAAELLRHFYPPGPNWRVQDSSIVRQEIVATWSPSNEQTVVLRGSFVLKHPYGKNAPGRIEAQLAGFIHFDGERRVTSFDMASTSATFAFEWEGKEHSERMSIAVEMEK